MTESNRKNIIFDSQILNSVQLCGMRTDLSFNKDLQPPTKPTPMEEGDLLHRMFEFYNLKLKEFQPDILYSDESFEQLVVDSIAHGESEALTMGLYPGETNEVILHFEKYVRHTRMDGVKILEVERPFLVELYSDDDLRILYAGKIDRLTDTPQHGIVPRDYKSARRNQEPESLSNQFTGYCFHEDTEVLTLEGWKRFPELKPEDKVAQFDNGEISFVQPTQYIEKEIDEELISFSGRINQIVTKEHRILCRSATSGKYKVYTAEEFPIGSGNNRFVVSGIKADGFSPDLNYLRFLVAFQADGSIIKGQDNIIRFGFNRRDKFVRLLEILDGLEIKYNLHNLTHQNYGIYIPKNDISIKAIELLGENKDFGPWLLNYDYNSLSFFIDELQYWDGSDRGNRGILYSTTNENNAKWVQTIASLSGRYASIHTQQKLGEKVAYRVNITKYALISAQHNVKSKIPYKGKVYCVNVPSSFLMTRLYGKIVFSGNSYATGASTVFVDKVGFQKTLSPEERFRSYALFYTDSMLERWRQTTIWWGKQYAFYIEENTWPENRTSCDKYGGCLFIPICKAATDEARLHIMQAQFVIGDKWDPTKVLRKDKSDNKE